MDTNGNKKKLLTYSISNFRMICRNYIITCSIRKWKKKQTDQRLRKFSMLHVWSFFSPYQFSQCSGFGVMPVVCHLAYSVVSYSRCRGILFTPDFVWTNQLLESGTSCLPFFVVCGCSAPSEHHVSACHLLRQCDVFLHHWPSAGLFSIYSFSRYPSSGLYNIFIRWALPIDDW